MKRLLLLSLCIFFSIVGCNQAEDPIQPANKIVSWAERKAELTEKLSQMTTPEAQVIFLREYVHNSAMLGDPSVAITKTHPDPNALDIETWHNAMIRDEFSVSASGMVSYLIQVYKEFGYLAFFYAEGTEQNGTGQVIVRFPREGVGTIYAIMDPMYNLHYTDPSGLILDIRTQIKMLARTTGRDSVRVVKSNSMARYLQKDNFVYTNESFGGYDGTAAEKVTYTHNEQFKYAVHAPRDLMKHIKAGYVDQYIEMATLMGYNVDFDNEDDWKWMPMLKRRIYGDKAHLLEATLNQIIYKETLDELEEMKFEEVTTPVEE